MSPELLLMTKLSITTGGGDFGETTIFGGRESKDYPRVEMVGILDEIQANLGVIRVRLNEENSENVLSSEKIVRDLMSQAFVGFELEESIGLEKFKKLMTKEEIANFIELFDEGIKTETGNEEYFENMKKILGDKNERINLGNLKSKTEPEFSFEKFFESTKMTLKLMDENDPLKLELKKINEDFLNIAEMVKNSGYINLAERLEDIEYLESNLELEETLENGFKLFGKNSIEANLNLNRVLARRVERRMVTWLKTEEGKEVDDHVLVYLNRVSDVIYLMSIRENI